MSKIKLLKDEFIKGSLVLFIMINIFNFLNYIFHFSMARMLGAIDYGILAVLMSIGYIFGVSGEAINNIVSRYTSRFNAKKEYGKMKNFLKKSAKKGFKLSLVIYILYIPFAILLSFLLNINFFLLAMVGLFIFTDLLFGPMLKGTLQGVKRFTKLGGNLIAESCTKLIFGILLVYLGFRVYGAMIAVILSVIVSVIISLFLLKDILASKEKKVNIKGLYFQSFSFFIVTISITLMFSLDVIIARIFFLPEIVGKYAIASMLGKMIFFATVPISRALLPLSSENFEKNKKTRPMLYKAALFLSLLCLIAINAFAIFPKLVIGILFGAQYLDVSKILVFMGISFSLLAFTNLIVIYALSKTRKRFSLYLPIFVLIEAVLLIIFNSTLLQYSIAFLFSNLIMLIGTVFLIKNESKLFKKV